MGPVLFLDVDGVLNNLGTWRTCDDMIDADCAKRLFGLLSRTGAKVVLSSAWRGMPGLEARLARAGVMAHVVGRTPHGGKDECRGHEIEAWLESNPSPPSRYAIVDDGSDMLPSQIPYFVQTNFQNGGLLDEHVERLATILRPELKLKECPYCSDGKSTGLPGNACENCMNTGLAEPANAVVDTGDELHQVLADALRSRPE